MEKMFIYVDDLDLPPTNVSSSDEERSRYAGIIGYQSKLFRTSLQQGSVSRTVRRPQPIQGFAAPKLING
jgi:hypothetical protein